MLSVRYGSHVIEYTFQEREGLKSHYITVERGAGVILKGKPVSKEKADKLILKKARWILDKLSLVRGIDGQDIVTGSRLPYLGKTYYVEVAVSKLIKSVAIEFNQSKFRISVHNDAVPQQEIRNAIEAFYRAKATEKITPRIEKLSAKTKLSYEKLSYRKMDKRWGSCTPTNTIIINTEAIKLPFMLIDYLIVHELCHTKVKDHSKEFWAELSKHCTNWRELDERMKVMHL